MRNNLCHPIKILIITLAVFISPCQAIEITISNSSIRRFDYDISHSKLDVYNAKDYGIRWQRISGGSSSCIKPYARLTWTNNGASASGGMDEGIWYQFYSGANFDFSESPDVNIRADNGCIDYVFIKLDIGYFNGERQETRYSENIAIPAGIFCSLDIQQDIEFSKVNVGDSVNAVNISTNPSGDGVVTFRPNATDGDKGRLSNGNSSLTYSVAGGIWNNALAQWEGALDGKYTLKLDDIPRSAAPGKYSGNLTATILCQ